jgi:hypothetical protein
MYVNLDANMYAPTFSNPPTQHTRTQLLFSKVMMTHLFAKTRERLMSVFALEHARFEHAAWT